MSDLFDSAQPASLKSKLQSAVQRLAASNIFIGTPKEPFRDSQLCIFQITTRPLAHSLSAVRASSASASSLFWCAT